MIDETLKKVIILVLAVTIITGLSKISLAGKGIPIIPPPIRESIVEVS